MSIKPQDLLLAEHLSTEEVCELLEAYGFKDPVNADRNLQLMAEDWDSREMLGRIIGSVLQTAQHSPDPDAALNNFERFLAVVPHPVNLLGFLWDTPEALEAIILICGTSPFSAEILIRNPEYFYWVLDQLGSSWVKSEELYLKEARQIVNKFSDSALQLHALSRFKRREMLRISARDIIKVADVVATVTELSNLADTITELVYEICCARLVERYGTPQYLDRQGVQCTAGFAIIGMGKLGGRELNYSSDIDLIYLYDGEQGETLRASPVVAPPPAISPSAETQSTGARGVSNTEFFTKLAQAITNELSSFTEEGYFYRVDLRLRPEGSAGNVASSLAACRNYYSTWGETFERLAMIKARPVAGSPELGEQFCRAVRPFVYRKFLDFASLEEIQEIKTRIDSKLGSRKKQEAHVKLGVGGIREIEFFVQALQMVYGGRTSELQERSTMKALDKLLGHHFLTEKEHRDLCGAYLFLRDLEHKLQMVFHLQTHELPESRDDLYKCARRMGINGESVDAVLEQFHKIYRSHTANVSRMFQNLITLQRDNTLGSSLREAALVLNKHLPETEAFPLLARHGFKDLKSAYHQIVLLREAPSFAHSPSKMRNLLANLLPSLLKFLELSPDPDTGLANFERFAGALGERDSLYTLLNESPEIFSRLIRVLSSSQFLGDFLCRRPEFLDALVQEDLLEKRKFLRDLQAELRQKLRSAVHIEESKAALRAFHQKELFRIGMKDILGQLRRPQVGKQLAALAEACLLAGFEIACRELEMQFGPGFEAWARSHFAILALGKLGGSDLSYNSDLDLVFFYRADDPRQPSDTQHRCIRLVEALDEMLSVSHGEGSVYKIDTRLRPEGKKDELVVALHRYQEYLEKRAENWERLALVRHRIVLASRGMRRQIKRWIEAFVYYRTWDSTLVSEIARIRQRLELEVGKESDGQRFHFKVGLGGLVDVEFATQLLQMKHGAFHRALRMANTIAAMKKLTALELISREQFSALREGYEFLRLVENRLRITTPYGAGPLLRTSESLTRICRLLGPPFSAPPEGTQLFETTYLVQTREIRAQFQQILAALSAAKPN